jgi:hypothetical protein
VREYVVVEDMGASQSVGRGEEEVEGIYLNNNKRESPAGPEDEERSRFKVEKETSRRALRDEDVVRYEIQCQLIPICLVCL